MFKRIILIPFFIGSFLSSKSQVTRFEYGFTGGLNINSASGTGIDKDHKGILTGLSIGGHFKWNSTDHFGMRVLLSYDENGYAYRSLSFENSAGTGLVKADLLKQFNFLNLPVFVEYSFGNKVRINLDAGVFAGILLNSKLVTKYKDPLPPGLPAEIRSSSNDRHTINYGIALGFGLQVPIAPKMTLDFNLKNNTGLANIVQLNGNNNKIETNCFSIQAGLSFGL